MLAGCKSRTPYTSAKSSSYIKGRANVALRAQSNAATLFEKVSLLVFYTVFAGAG
jgi:hypothetical protein